MYDIHLHKHKTGKFSPGKQKQREDRVSSTFKMLLNAHHLYRKLFYHGYGEITDHLSFNVNPQQMSKGLIMFGKQLSWSPAGFRKPFFKKKNSYSSSFVL